MTKTGKQSKTTKKTTKSSKKTSVKPTVTHPTGAFDASSDGASLAPEEDGNKTSSSGRSNAMKHWHCRLSFENGSKDSIGSWVKEFCSEATYQAEEGSEIKDGETHGYRHWQLHLCLKKKQRWEWLKRHFHKDVWVEAARNIEASMNYCNKDATCFMGPFVYPETVQEVEDPLEGLEYYPWQKDIVEEIKTPPTKGMNRYVNWIWSKSGKMGKSAMCKHLYLKHGATFIGGKAADAAFAVKTNAKVVVCNIPRSKEKWIHPYDWAEGIIDGMIFSSKYESGAKVFNAPHIFFFANYPPDVKEMSEDRWKVVRIDSDVDELGDEVENAMRLVNN